MTDTTTYHKKLLAEKKVLYKELTELGVQNATVPEDWVATPKEPITAEADENVVADRKEDWIERRAEVAALETRYNNIISAIQKIKAGTYGHCEVCDTPIETDRLNANPAAQTCKVHLDNESPLDS